MASGGGLGRGCAVVLRAQLCCRNYSESCAGPRAAPPRPAPFPRGVETKGARRAVRSLGERGGEFRRSGALGSLGLCWRGHGVGLATRTQEVGGPRVSRPSGEGRRLRAQRRPVRRRAASPGLWSPKRGAAGRGRAPSAVLRDGAEAWAVGARGRREWSLRGVRRLCHLWACSRRFLARLVWWCREEGSAVTAPQLEPGFRGWGGPRTADLASWPRAGRAVTIGGGGPARSRGSCPAGRSLPSQVLAAAAVGCSARAGRAAGRWEPEGPHPSLGLRFGPAARRSLFPRWRGGAVSARGAAGPLPGRWSRCLASSLPRSLPFCRDAGEMMSPRRTRNPVERVVSGVHLLPWVSGQAAFCSQGMKVLSGLKRERGWFLKREYFRLLRSKKKQSFGLRLYGL